MDIVIDFLLFLLSVVFISLSGVMMPGPVFAVTVANGYKDKAAGALIALGHGVVEFPLIFLIYFGFTWFFASTTVQKIIGFVGGLILVFMGVQTLKNRNEAFDEHEGSKHGSFIAGVLTTSVNPYFFLWWATIGAALITGASAFGSTGFLIFSLTHWSCDLLWDTLVSVTVFRSRRFWTRKVQTVVFGFCFIILIGYGAWFIASSML